MSTSPPPPGPDRPPTEEELRAAYEAELKRIATTDVVLQSAVSLINLAGRRLGVAPGSQDERDLEQVRDAIDAVRGLLPVLDRRKAPELGPIRDALSQLQMAYAQETAGAGPGAGAAPGAAPGAEGAGKGDGGVGDGGVGEADPAPKPSDRPGTGPAQSSGRLWVPGQ